MKEEMVRYLLVWHDIVCCPSMKNLSTCHTYRYCALKNLLCIIKYHQVHCSNMEIMKFPLCTIYFNLFNAYARFIVMPYQLGGWGPVCLEDVWCSGQIKNIDLSYDSIRDISAIGMKSMLPCGVPMNPH